MTNARRGMIACTVVGLVACNVSGINRLPDALEANAPAPMADAAVAKGDERFLAFVYVWGIPRFPGLDSACAAGLTEKRVRAVRLFSDVVEPPRTAADSAKEVAKSERIEAERRYMTTYNSRVAQLTGTCAKAGASAA
jgi:hypothetical protein